MDKELEKFKTEINLEEFLIHFHGYEKDKGYTRNSPKLVKYNEQGQSISKLILKKNTKGHWTYWDVHNPDEIKGKTIIDFIQQNQKTKKGEFMTIGHVRKFLRSMLRTKNKKILLKKTIITPGTNKNILTILRDEKKLFPIKDFEFLKKRGIKEETYMNPAFNKLLYNVKNDKGFINTGYLLINKNIGEEAISVRNKDFKGVIGKKVDKIGATYVNKENINNIKNIVVTESFLDSMAHHQLLKTNLNNTRYLSTEGALTLEQMELIKESCEKHQIEQLKLAFDNDITGEQYSAKLTAYLLNNKDCLFEPKYNSETKNAELDVIITTGSLEKNIIEIKELQKEFEKLNDKLVYRVLETKPFEIKAAEVSENKAILKVKFKNIKPLWEELNEHLINQAQKLNFDIKRETPKTLKEEYSHVKDWNDLLLDNNTKKDKNTSIKI